MGVLNFLRHIKMTEKDLFGIINSTIGGIGAALCSLFGTIVNVMAIVMILKRPKIKKHLIAPILFIMCMSNLTFSLISMPITSYRFFVRSNWANPTGTFCKLFPIVFFANVNVCTITTALITLNRAIALWNFHLAEKMFTWKKTLIYFVILWIYSIGFLSLPLLEIWGDFKYCDGTFSSTFDNE